jgi:ribosomal protein S18 acetylase RimI-like enzyme
VRTLPLSEYSSRELQPLLSEESDHWRSELLWDFGEVSTAVASGLDRGALTGRVIEEGRRAVAYCYCLPDSGRLVVGSLFATAPLRGRGIEEDLLEAVLAEAQSGQGRDRVECQTLFSTSPGVDSAFGRAGFSSRARHYLLRPLDQPIPSLPDHDLRLRPLGREDLAQAAHIIYRSHQGSLDAALNMTYATFALCRGFVETLVLRNGCGRFDPEASLVAEGREGPLGVLLASRLSRVNGHVCQVSVLPELQSRGAGTALLSASLAVFARAGLSAATLSVTVANRRAYALYQRLGFRVRREFAAHAWVRPPARIELPA